VKRIIYFEIVDHGVLEGMATPIKKMRDAMVPIVFNGYTCGVGTDAESALDDMLHMMQEDDFDVTRLEGQVKEEWEPSQDEGDGRKFYYHFGIVYRWAE
jgi:hypothetical protein